MENNEIFKDIINNPLSLQIQSLKVIKLNKKKLNDYTFKIVQSIDKFSILS
jgi:hypothetical protein